MKDRAMFEQENERRRKMEEEMRAQLSQQSQHMAEGGLQGELARLQQLEAEQREEIQR